MRYREGKAVEKDLVQACALYSAAINGREDPDQKKGMSVERDKLGKELSADQFRARLSASLESGVRSAPDGRELRLLPPIDPKDAMFIYQPAERRFGFVGRIEFRSREEGAL